MRRRGLAVLALAVVALAGGVIAGWGRSGHEERTLAGRFVSAWAHQNYVAMYAEIDRAARRATSPSAFAAIYESAWRTATATDARVRGPLREPRSGVVVVPVRLHTRIFGTIDSAFTLRFHGSGQAAQIAWTPALEFPGMHGRQRLSRHTALPQRAELLTRERSVLASGPATAAGERYSPLGGAASAIVGSVGPVPSGERRRLESEGVPPNAIVGVSGLESIFDSRLRGRPGGQLLAGGRVIARAKARPGSPVRTTISAPVQSAAVEALGGQYGGVVALQPRTGQVLGVAGIGLDGLQPPGSTFKMVTVTGVLSHHVATADTVFPYATAATLDGVKLHNSEGESCGGSLTLAFAVSCNSVFAPLGVKLGAKRLVATAESYGFNHAPSIPGAAESTIPQAGSIQGELALGSTAIGQGEVLATPLEMATIAATIASGGRRAQPTLSPAASAIRRVRASSAAIARTVRTMMIAVVREGTGTAAAISGVTVAGKTGTAELGPPPTPPSGGGEGECAATVGGSGESGEGEEGSTGEQASEAGGESCESSSSESNPEDTDAWFAAFAPAQAPRIAVGVLMVRDGFGGESAAPVARQVLEAGLRG